MIALLASALLAAAEKGGLPAAKPDVEYATTTSRRSRGRGSAPPHAGGDEALLRDLDLLEKLELLENLDLFEPSQSGSGSNRP